MIKQSSTSSKNMTLLFAQGNVVARKEEIESSARQ